MPELLLCRVQTPYQKAWSLWVITPQQLWMKVISHCLTLRDRREYALFCLSSTVDCSDSDTILQFMQKTARQMSWPRAVSGLVWITEHFEFMMNSRWLISKHKKHVLCFRVLTAHRCLPWFYCLTQDTHEWRESKWFKKYNWRLGIQQEQKGVETIFTHKLLIHFKISCKELTKEQRNGK